MCIPYLLKTTRGYVDPAREALGFGLDDHLVLMSTHSGIGVLKSRAMCVTCRIDLQIEIPMYLTKALVRGMKDNELSLSKLEYVT